MAKALGKRVKDFRLSKLLTQPQVALMLGVSISTVVRLEMGKDVADLTRAKIEQFLDRQESVAAA